MLCSLLIGSLAAWMSGSAPVRESSQPHPVTSVAIDAVTPVRDRNGAIMLVEKLLARLEARGEVACFDLQAKGAEMLSSCAIESYGENLFPQEQRRLSAVSLTLREASEIERRNEAVRDRVIDRECSGQPRSSQCGGTVHASAIALLENTQRDTEAKLEALRQMIAGGTQPVVVLITAGLPFRHEPRVLNQLMADFRERRIRLILVRLESATEFSGLLSDAAEELSSRLKDVRSIVLRSDHELNQLLALISPRPDAIPSVGDRSGSAPTSGAAEILNLLRAYVARFATGARFVIAHEHYKQEVRSRAGSFGATAGIVAASRSSEADVAFAQIADGMWIMTRQVSTVDGRSVSGAPSPFLADVQTEREAVERMRQLADEAARWNIGSVRRNINTPTLVMWFLTSPIAERFRLSVGGIERTAAGICQVVRFREVSSPPLMQVEHSRTPASGRIWVLRESGAVVKTELVLEQTVSSTRGEMPVSRTTITVDYLYWPAADVWVPAIMIERYEQPATRDSEVVLCRASYSQYRRFTVGVRIK
jgi:hypothetical protein